jgi:hypothetical protein
VPSASCPWASMSPPARACAGIRLDQRFELLRARRVDAPKHRRLRTREVGAEGVMTTNADKKTTNAERSTTNADCLPS